MCHICGNISIQDRHKGGILCDYGGVSVEEFEPIYVLTKQIMSSQ